MGTSKSSVENSDSPAITNPELETKPISNPTSSKQTATKPIHESYGGNRYDSIFLITAYSHSIIHHKENHIVPSDIINIIFMYFHLKFHFDVIPKIKRCGTKNILKPLEETGWNEEEVVIVVAVESECVYVGFAGDDEPSLAVPNIIAIGKDNEVLVGHQLNNDTFNLSAAIRPFQFGEIKDYEAMKKLFLKIFCQISKDEMPSILFTEPAKCNYREEITKFAFEELRCQKFYLQPRSVLALYSSGRTLGIVVHSDYESTEIVPVYEGYSVRDAVQKINFGKRDVIDYLEENRYNKDNVVTDGMELFFDRINIHKEIWDCILRCNEILKDKDSNYGKQAQQREYCKNIVLSGINTKYDGLQDKLQQEMIGVIRDVDDSLVVRVIAAPEREIFPWIGGSILSSLSTFEYMWIQKEEYDEKGPSVVEKCDTMIM